VEFSGVVQQHTDSHGGELTAAGVWNLFSRTYLEVAKPVRYIGHHLSEHGSQQAIELQVEINGVEQRLVGEGNGPIDAAVHALARAGLSVQVRSFEERSTSASHEAGDAQACAFLELAPAAGGNECFGVHIDGNIVTASIKALVSGVNRLGLQASPASMPKQAEAQVECA
jgi:2-isopropylmalate synthase